MAEYVFKIDGEIKACYSDVYSQDGYCPFHFYAFNSGSHCSISNCKCTKTKRPEGCPLKELKAHGRLVDADTNREDFMDTVYSELYSDGDNYRANRIIDAYDNAPTILEASNG